jgi:CysZ protein
VQFDAESDVMLAAVAKALDQMFTPPFRAVLAKSVGLAVALMVVLVIVLFRLLEWLSGSGLTWLEMASGPWAHTPLAVLGWVIAVALGVGLLAGAILLMPAVTAVVASLFSDEISEIVEREHYPQDAPGRPLPILVAAIEGTKIGLLSIVVYLVAAPFLLFAGIGVLLFFLATAWLQGLQYFELVAMRFHPAAEAKALRRINQTTVFIAGLFIAGFVSIPILNLATPLFGTALMVHIYKRLAAANGEAATTPLRAPIRMP